MKRHAAKRKYFGIAFERKGKKEGEVKSEAKDESLNGATKEETVGYNRETKKHIVILRRAAILKYLRIS